MEYLVIDGYNVINAWGDVFNLRKDSLEDCRDKLFEILSNYQGYKKTNIIIVFDAHMVKSTREKNQFVDNLTVVFTKEHVTADNYIERFVHRMGSDHTIRVVTSDYLEQTMILGKGGIRITPKEMREEIRLINTSVKSKMDMNKAVMGKTNTIMANLNPELLEKLEKIRREKF